MTVSVEKGNRDKNGGLPDKGSIAVVSGAKGEDILFIDSLSIMDCVLGITKISFLNYLTIKNLPYFLKFSVFTL